MQKRREEGDNAVVISFEDLPDGIFFEIVSFGFGSTLNLSKAYNQSSVYRMLAAYLYVSKESQRRCISYIRSIPIHIPSVLDNSRNLIEWMCRNRIKIGHIFCNFFRPIMADKYLRILKECDITEMSSIRVGGGPYEATDLGEILLEQAPALKVLHLIVTKEDRRKCSLLYVLGDRLTELTIVIASSIVGRNEAQMNIVTHIDYDKDGDLQEIGTAIRGMKKIQKLSILPMLPRICSFKIHSESLEVIDILSSGKQRLLIEECVCPSLKLYQGRVYELPNIVGLKACTPIKKSEIEFEAMKYIDFAVGTRPFYGMEVPASCIVRLLSK